MSRNKEIFLRIKTAKNNAFVEAKAFTVLTEAIKGTHLEGHYGRIARAIREDGKYVDRGSTHNVIYAKKTLKKTKYARSV